MSTRKLLISAAAAALLAGGASALTLSQGDADASATPGYITAASVLATEATLAASGADTGVFELIIDGTGTFAANENYFVDVTVSGGTWSTNLGGSEVTDGAVVVISGSSVQFTDALNPGTPLPGTGQAGERFVRYLVSNDSFIGDDFGLEMPVTFGGCGADGSGTISFSVTVQTTAGVAFEEGTATLSPAALSCANAYKATIATDVDGTDNDSVLESPGFATFVTSVTRPDTDELATGIAVAQGTDTGTVASLGQITVGFDPDGVTTSFLTSLDASTGPLTGALGEVTSVDFDVDFAGNPAGILSGDFDQTPEAVVPLTTGSGSFTDTITVGLSLGDHIESLLVTIDGTTQVAQQTVSSSNGVLNFGAALGIVASEAAMTMALDDINFEGVTCGTFDWVGDATKPTANIWRVTGAGSTTTDVIATLSNSSNGPSFDTAYTLPAYDFTQSEVVINSAQLGAAAGEFGRADVLFNFIGASDALDCDRLMNSDAANIITAFGNKDQDDATDADGDD